MSTGMHVACDDSGREGSMYVEYNVEDEIGKADGGSFDSRE